MALLKVSDSNSPEKVTRKDYLFWSAPKYVFNVHHVRQRHESFHHKIATGMALTLGYFAFTSEMYAYIRGQKADGKKETIWESLP